MNNLKYSKVVSLISGSITFGILAWLIIYSFKDKNITPAFSAIKPIWFAGAVFCLLVFLVFDALNFYILTLSVNNNATLRQSFYVTFIGRFYLNVTPVGIPVQIKMIADNGVNAGMATSIYTQKSKIYQIVLTGFAVFGLLYEAFSPYQSNLLWFAIIIILFNGLMVTLYFLFTIIPDRFINLGKKLIALLPRIKFIKNTDKISDKLERHMIAYFEQLRLFKNEKQVNIRTYIFTFFEIAALYSVTFCLYKAFGNSGHNILELILAQAVASALAALIFLPSNAGGAEGGFYLFCAPFFSEEQIAPAIVLWRFITYFIMVMLGGVTILEKRIRDKTKATD